MKKHIFFLLLLIGLNSCDAVNILSYQVKNNTSEEIQIHVPNYSKNRNPFETVDTVIRIPPKSRSFVGLSSTDINFPWATRKIYKRSPGMCGIERIRNNSSSPIDCDEKTWKYKRGMAIHTIQE